MINQIDTNNLCPIHFGLFYLDQSHKSDLQKEIKFQSIFEPLIIIGRSGVNASPIEAAYSSVGKVEILTISFDTPICIDLR